jgi:hypothetical protein
VPDRPDVTYSKLSPVTVVTVPSGLIISKESVPVKT